MFGKLTALIDLFRKGSEVSNVEAWKSGGIKASALAAAMLAVVKVLSSFGYEVPLTPEQINDLAAGLLLIVGVLLPAATSKRAGILPTKEVKLAPIEDHSFAEGVPSVGDSTESATVQSDDKAFIGTNPDPWAGIGSKR